MSWGSDPYGAFTYGGDPFAAPDEPSGPPTPKGGGNLMLMGVASLLLALLITFS